MKKRGLFKDFILSEKTSGLVLVLFSLLSLIISNLSFGTSYMHFWDTLLFGHSLHFWINDVLMTIFFLMVGLEIEREFYTGELSSFKKAILPVIAAMGGMFIPAFIGLRF